MPLAVGNGRQNLESPTGDPERARRGPLDAVAADSLHFDRVRALDELLRGQFRDPEAILMAQRLPGTSIDPVGHDGHLPAAILTVRAKACRTKHGRRKDFD